MSDFVRVCKTSDIPDPGKAVFEVEDRFVVVFHVAGQFYALDDCCTHDGGPLGEGELRVRDHLPPARRPVRHPHRRGALHAGQAGCRRTR